MARTKKSVKVNEQNVSEKVVNTEVIEQLDNDTTDEIVSVSDEETSALDEQEQETEDQEQETTEQFKHGNHIIIIEPHEQGSRVVLATKHGLYVTEHVGDKNEGIKKVKAHAEAQ